MCEVFNSVSYDERFIKIETLSSRLPRQTTLLQLHRQWKHCAFQWWCSVVFVVPCECVQSFHHFKNDFTVSKMKPWKSVNVYREVKVSYMIDKFTDPLSGHHQHPHLSNSALKSHQKLQATINSITRHFSRLHSHLVPAKKGKKEKSISPPLLCLEFHRSNTECIIFTIGCGAYHLETYCAFL